MVTPTSAVPVASASASSRHGRMDRWMVGCRLFVDWMKKLSKCEAYLVVFSLSKAGLRLCRCEMNESLEVRDE